MGVVVTGTISQSSILDTYPTHDSALGLGGKRECMDIAVRNAIPELQRTFGMLVTVNADGTPANNTTYILANVALGGTNNTLTDNANWIEFTATGGAGITSLNLLTGAAQTFAAGTAGTDFAISSAGTTHTFDLPTASAVNTGKLSNTDWSTFNSKQAAITGAASTIVTSDLTINRAVISNGLGKIDVSLTTDTELGYVSGVTSAIQTQLNNRPTGVAGTTGRLVKYTAAGTIANSVVFTETDGAADYVTLIHNGTLSNATSIRGSGGNVRMDLGNNTNHQYIVSTDNHVFATGNFVMDQTTFYMSFDTDNTFFTMVAATSSIELNADAATGAGRLSLALATGVAIDSTVDLLLNSPTVKVSYLTSGSVLFAGASGLISQDNTNYFWDNTNKRLGLRQSVPTATLDIIGAGATSATYGLKVSGSGPTLNFSVRDDGEVDSLNGYSIGGELILFSNNSITPSLSIGENAANANTVGQQNVFIGFGAGENATAAAEVNTVIGAGASPSVTGDNNSVLGAASASALVGGGQNTVLGALCGTVLTTGDTNVMLGYGAGQGITSGAQNVFLGPLSGATSNLSNTIAIGYNAMATASAQLVLGSAASPINNAYFGRGVSCTLAQVGTVSLEATGITAGVADQSAAGGIFYITGARGTGTGLGGDVIIRTAPPSTTGSTQNNVSNVLIIRGIADQNVDCVSTNGAFIPPRLTETQRDALIPIDGMIIYNSTAAKLQVREAGAWVNLI